MFQAIVIILILVAIGAVSWYIKWNAKRGEWMEEAVTNMTGIGLFKVERTFKYEYVTPQGARVKSVVPVPAAALAAIDSGLQRRIDRFSLMFPKWTKYKKVSDHDIFMIPPRGQNQVNAPGSPFILVRGTQAAGTVLGLNDHYEAISIRPIIVVAHQQDSNWTFLDYLAEAVHNESEHVAGFLSRQEEPTGVFYNFLGENDVHPWSWGEAKGFASTQEKHSCNVQ